jgi:cytochrome c biogenesis protein CcdA
MEYYSLLLLGGLIGMQHVVDADHLAAIATMNTTSSSRRGLLLRGGLWGLGHTVTLLSICGALLLWGGTISPRTQALLQLLVGTMIIVLGANVLYRLWRQRPHLHFHKHGTGVHHLHVHVHAGETIPHSHSRHAHRHPEPGMVRAVVIGMIHGTAGSAGLLLLATTAGSAVDAITYVLAFGTGSIIGMMALSLVVSYPIRFLERSAGWMNTAGLASVGCATIIIGVHLCMDTWAKL